MAKHPTKKSHQKKRRRAREQEPRALRVKIKKRDLKDVELVELAIQRKLDAEPTDLFRDSDTLIIVVEGEGS
jgi:hypothetical protein